VRINLNTPWINLGLPGFGKHSVMHRVSFSEVFNLSFDETCAFEFVTAKVT
jgi:hypothetical protein